MVKQRYIKCPENKYSIKCPYTMKPTRIVIHNTDNDAPAINEINYMHNNNNQVSFHYAIDDKEIIQGLPLDRNSWNAGDGANGKGNREGIAIEICYSLSGGAKFDKALKNAAEFTASLLKKYGWGIEKVTKHQDYNGKHCPARILDHYGWDKFKKLVQSYMTSATTTTTTKKKTIEEIAKEVINGKWGNGEERRKKLKAAGYDPDKVQAKVNALISASSKVETYTTMTVKPASGLYYHKTATGWNKVTRLGVWSKGTKVNVVKGFSTKCGSYTSVKVKTSKGYVYCAKEYLK